MKMDILFKNATVVTMNPEAPVLENVNLGITGRKITYLSASSAFDDFEKSGLQVSSVNGKPVRIIDCTHKVIMPGLYNCHTHAGMTLFRGFANDRALEDWLFNHLIPAESKLQDKPELVRTGTNLAMAEMLSSGTVAFSDMYCHMDIVAQAAADAGMLANICNGVIGFDPATNYHETNEYKQTIRAMEANHEKTTDNRIRIEASIHGVYTSHPQCWTQAVEFAQKNNLRMHLHLSETKTEHEGCITNHGATPAQTFAKYGVFDIPTTAAHGVWVTDEDISLFAEKGVTITHNPLSNLKLASGLAPVAKMLKNNVNVALGTDGMASNNSHDLFEELKMASLLQKYATSDPTALPAYETLALATTNGAKAQGRATESGTIKEGYDADLILIDFNNERQTMCYSPILNLAYSTSGRDVELTMVRGKILYEKGEFTTIDIEKTLHEARAAKKLFV
jgi:5-methylthioadenosine/S-adenosylhomocysteine deaminase